jgi:hypothetical protein
LLVFLTTMVGSDYELRYSGVLLTHTVAGLRMIGKLDQYKSELALARARLREGRDQVQYITSSGYFNQSVIWSRIMILCGEVNEIILPIALSEGILQYSENIIDIMGAASKGTGIYRPEQQEGNGASIVDNRL